MAPEVRIFAFQAFASSVNALQILLDKKYGRAVDWWAFGVLIYQMLLQQSPFRGEDEDEIYDAILADEPLYPIHMPRDSVSILQKLLTREPELRLGSGPTDAQEVMSHAFFRNINWDDIYHKRVPPPFMPTISSPTDTSNFDQEFTSVTPVLTPVQSGKISPVGIGCFKANDVISSPLPSYAGGVPRLLVHCGLRLRYSVLIENYRDIAFTAHSSNEIFGTLCFLTS
jgi:serine/threonine protein kinase